MTDKQLVAELAAAIAAASARPLTIMEVCGTHTMSIYRYGLRSLLPPQIRLVSGPGCPVCVTDSGMVAAALSIARAPGVIFTSFGDMLRVPAGRDSLLACRDQGADVRVVLSPLDALALAKKHPAQPVVFFAVGFETTAPLTASTVELAAAEEVDNFFIIPAHKTMPQALRALLAGADNVGALLCPGHVTAVIGARSFAFVAEELGKPAAVSGFTPTDILLAVRELVEQAERGEARLANCYQRAVKERGNPYALAALDKVFAPCDALWRGLGLIPASGLALRPAYAHFDALRRFAAELAAGTSCVDHPACRCGAVLRGEIAPEQCPLFGKTCAPAHPVGACMVSGEGSCAAAYKYRE